jgi:hypothetical protein
MAVVENDHHRGVKFAPPPSSSLAHAPRPRPSSSRTPPQLHHPRPRTLHPRTRRSSTAQMAAPARAARCSARMHPAAEAKRRRFSIHGSQPLDAPSPAAEQARAGGHGSGVELDLGCCGPESSAGEPLHHNPESSSALASLLPACSWHMRLRREAMQFCIPSLLQRQFALLIASPIGELCGHAQW